MKQISFVHCGRIINLLLLTKGFVLTVQCYTITNNLFSHKCYIITRLNNMLTNAKLVFNKNINEKHTEAAIKHAEYLCLQKQQKFTSLRRTVFEILWEDYQPLGAYEIKQRLSMRLGRKIDPPTVYRAIEFFVDLGLANKIESLNAYIGCPFPSSQRSYIFLICENCKNVAEVSTGSVDNSLALIMEKLKFKLRKQHIEVRGICSKCSP